MATEVFGVEDIMQIQLAKIQSEQQNTEDMIYDQMSFRDYGNPFTGRK